MILEGKFSIQYLIILFDVGKNKILEKKGYKIKIYPNENEKNKLRKSAKYRKRKIECTYAFVLLYYTNYLINYFKYNYFNYRM